MKDNSDIEQLLKFIAGVSSLHELSLSHFLDSRITVPMLKKFIQVRKWKDAKFHESELVGSDGKKLNKIRYGPSAQSIENNCSDESPCLVWIAWKLRSSPLIMEELSQPNLDTSLKLPEFSVAYAGPGRRKSASEYLTNADWVGSLCSVIKGINTCTIDGRMLSKADALSAALDQRLDLHIADRVDKSRRTHWTLRFTKDNIPPMAAAMCIAGHVSDDLDTFGIEECLLKLPLSDIYELISGNLAKWKDATCITTDAK